MKTMILALMMLVADRAQALPPDNEKFPSANEMRRRSAAHSMENRSMQMDLHALFKEMDQSSKNGHYETQNMVGIHLQNEDALIAMFDDLGYHIEIRDAKIEESVAGQGDMLAFVSWAKGRKIDWQAVIEEAKTKTDAKFNREAAKERLHKALDAP